MQFAARPVLLALMVLLVALLPARAQSVEELVNQLPEGGFSDRSAIIAQLAATGDTRLVPVLEALGAGELNVVAETGQVVFVRPAGGNVAITDALTGEDAGEVASGAVDRIRVNNSVRRAVRTAIGQLTLLSPNANTRLSAARAMFQAADPDNLPLLDEAIAQEEDASVLQGHARRPGRRHPAHRCLGRGFRRSRRHHRRARRPPCARHPQCAAGERAGRDAADHPVGHRGDREPSAPARCRPERLVRHLARLRAAARRHRPRHHLRRHGRHQHGAWRDGDDRRLHDLRGAEHHPRLRARTVRLVAGIALPLAFLVTGCRHRHRARRHPLALRPPAGNAARHLGPVADHPAGRAHHLRRRPTARSATRPGCRAPSTSTAS
jgi:hypothetical protein